MNKWTKLSMELTYKESYFDRLLEIYPIKVNPKRNMPDDLKEDIENAYDNADFVNLIKALNIGVKKYELKFPIDCSYVPIFRKELKWLKKNPITVDIIGRLLFNLSKEKILKRCIKPKKSSRQIGPEFNQWFENKFSDDEEIEILGKSDGERKKKAKQLISYHRNKGLDLFIRINNIYIIGEAKFLTDEGDAQWSRLETAFKIFDSFDKKDNVIPIVILDGICYRTSKTKFYRKINESKDNQIIISALLLNELFNKIKELTLSEEGIDKKEILKLI